MSRSGEAAAAIGGRPGRLSVNLGRVVEAAHAAVQPSGSVRWIAEPALDRIELRLVVRRWSTGTDPAARLARLAAGAALRAARLAVSVQGLRPVVSYGVRPDLLAVLHVGDVAPIRREEMLLYAALQDEVQLPRRCPNRTAALQALRRAAESEGTWLRALEHVPPLSAALGPRWNESSSPQPRFGGLAVVIGATGPVPAVDLRLGQALETVRLTAAAVGLAAEVLAPAASAAVDVSRHRDHGADVLAVLRLWPPAP